MDPSTTRPHSNRRPRALAILTAAVLLSTTAIASAIPIPARRAISGITGPNTYDTDFTRAYEECTAPNDVSSDGIPACSPPVTSVCEFASATMRIRPTNVTQEIEVSARLNGVDGPGACTTGIYGLQLLMRTSTDDETCTGGSCTWIDFPLGFNFTTPSIGGNAVVSPVTIESAIHSLAPGTDLDDATYEILSARILDPFGSPIAAAGIGNHKAKTFLSNLGPAYPSCDVPNETNNTGTIPVCAPISWTPLCDANAGLIEWNDPGATPFVLKPRLFKLAGSSPDCATGTYQYVSTLRITTNDCGGAAVPCTLVDTPVTIPVTPTKSDVEDIAIPITASGLTGPIDSIEVLQVRVLEPSSAPLFSAALTNAWRVGKPSVQIGRKKLEVDDDDQIKVQGRMLRVPTVDPNAGAGVTVSVNDHVGSMYTVTIPAGSWEVRGIDSWRYQDKTAALNGVYKATIKRGNSPDGSGYLVKLQAKNRDLSAATYPGVDVVLQVPQAGGASVITAKANRTCKVGTKLLKCK